MGILRDSRLADGPNQSTCYYQVLPIPLIATLPSSLWPVKIFPPLPGPRLVLYATAVLYCTVLYCTVLYYWYIRSISCLHVRELEWLLYRRRSLGKTRGKSFSLLLGCSHLTSSTRIMCTVCK